MENQEYDRNEGGQSIVLVAVAMVALVIFVAITVDMSNAYRYRRIAQNAADAAALGGAEELARQMEKPSPADQKVAAYMNDFGERNEILDTDGALANAVNENVVGYYLDDKQAEIGLVGGGSVPKRTAGIRAYTYITAPTFFGGIMGFDGYPLSAKAAVYFQVACTGGWCMLPIAVHDTGFLTATQNAEGQCFNMWDGAADGNFGWVNWSLQSSEENGYTYSCTDEALRQWDFANTLPITLPGDCSADCLDINMDPNYCIRINPEDIAVGDAVGGTTGVKNGDMIRDRLKYYILDGAPVKILVYDQTLGNKKKGAEQGCATLNNNGGLRYSVAGFACFEMTGFRLSHGQGATECDLIIGADGARSLACQECTSETDPATKITTVSCPGRDESALSCSPALAADYPGVCEDPEGNPCEFETGAVNRITGRFVNCFAGSSGRCKATGSMLAPRLDE